jgi:hypothetical protein
VRTTTRSAAAAALATLTAFALTPAAEADSSSTSSAVLFFDDFQSGFDTTNTWSLLATPSPAGTLPQGDGIVTASSAGLTVTPTGTNPVTGLPAYAATTGQQAAGGGGSDADHIKWLALPARTASSGLPGFDVPATGSLTCSALISAQGLGLDGQPFGAEVADPQSDPRLASASLIAADFGTDAVADIAETNTEIYAVYERLRAPGSTYAAYSFVIPVAPRTPSERDLLQIRYDEGGSRVTWLVNGRQVLSTDQIGTLAFSRSYLVLDHGGSPQRLALKQTVCALGTGDELDGASPDGTGLVQLDSTPGYYYDPRVGQPAPASFLHTDDSQSERLFGQGEILHVCFVSVTRNP